MKKLNLGKLKLAAADVLQRSQLAGIYGGSGGGSGCSVCYFYDPSGNVNETLNSAGSCQAGGVCHNTPSCFTWSCH